jgi:insertion element IS1 protein InsB
MVQEPILCPACNTFDVVKHGKFQEGKQRYKCRNLQGSRSTFIRHYSYRGYLPEVKQQIADMAVNGSGIRDTARVLKISLTTVIEALKKSRHLKQVNPALLGQSSQSKLIEVWVKQVNEAERDEMWSFVGNQKQQRWLWHAIDPITGDVLADVLAPHTDAALESLIQLLTPFGIQRFYTDG